LTEFVLCSTVAKNDFEGLTLDFFDVFLANLAVFALDTSINEAKDLCAV